jgi:hypothetical protein
VEHAVPAPAAKSEPNGRARASVLVGLLAVAAMPAGILLAAYSSRVDLTYAAAAIPVAIGLGSVAVALSRSARRHSQISLGRVGGLASARIGGVLGLLGLYLAAMALLAIAFFGLLLLFD